MNNKKIKNKIQVINIKDDSILIFNLKGNINKEDCKRLRNTITEQTKCKCLLLGDGIELDSILNRTEAEHPHQNLRTKKA